MKKLEIIFLIPLFLSLTSCHNQETSYEKSQKEFYLVVNYLIDSVLTDISAISSLTMPIIKPFQIPAEKIVDSVNQPDPAPFGVIQYNWLSIYPLALRRNLNKTEVDFMYQAIDSSKIEIIDSSKVKIPVLTKAIFLELFQDSGINVGYQRIKKRYGTSCYVSVSTPIFNSNFTKVIISIDKFCGPLWGNGYEFVLEKKKGIWTIVDKSITWIS
jgi:hypothetical protein